MTSTAKALLYNSLATVYWITPSFQVLAMSNQKQKRSGAENRQAKLQRQFISCAQSVPSIKSFFVPISSTDPPQPFISASSIQSMPHTAGEPQLLYNSADACIIQIFISSSTYLNSCIHTHVSCIHVSCLMSSALMPFTPMPSAPMLYPCLLYPLILNPCE